MSEIWWRRRGIIDRFPNVIVWKIYDIEDFEYSSTKILLGTNLLKIVMI